MKTIIKTIRLGEAEHDYLKRKADGRPFCWIIRKALDAYLTQEEKDEIAAASHH